MLQFLTMFLGPTQIGGWVRAAVASGLTLFSTKYLPALAGVDVTSIISDVATVASTVVVGLWSSLTKTGTVSVPVVAGSTVSVANPSTTHVIPHETTH